MNICDQNGFQYSKETKENKAGETRWICHKCKKGCKAVVKTKGDFIVAQKNDHTCIWKANKVNLKLIFLGFTRTNEQFTLQTNKSNGFNISDQNGFIYNKRKEANRAGETLWTCLKRKGGGGCKVVVKTLGDFIIAKKNDHTCIWKANKALNYSSRF